MKIPFKKSILGFIIGLAFVASLANADVTVNFWQNLAGQGLVTNTGNGYANADIHVAHCYIGLGTATPCGAVGSSTRLNTILAANGTNTINNLNFNQIWQWNSLTAGPAFTLSSNSTLTTNNSFLFFLNLSGANATSGVASTTLAVSNVKTGTTASNIGIQSVVTSASSQNFASYNVATGPNSSTNYGVYSQSSGTTSSINYGVYSIVSGTGTTNTGIYTQSSGATTNYGLIVGSPGERNGFGILTPSANVDINNQAIGQTQLNSLGLALTNNTAALVAAQQFSPAIRWHGSGWKTNATAGSQTVDFRAYVKPIQGGSAPSGQLRFDSSIAGGAYGLVFAIGNNGELAAGGAFGSSGDILQSNGTGFPTSWVPPSSIFSLTNGTGTTANGTAVDLGGNLNSIVVFTGADSSQTQWVGETDGFYLLDKSIGSGLYRVSDDTLIAGYNSNDSVYQYGGNVLNINLTDSRVGINTPIPSSSLDVNGTLALKIRIVGSANVPAQLYAATEVDHTISVIVGTTGSLNVNLPSPVDVPGRIYVVKRYSDSDTGAVTIDNAAPGGIENRSGVFGTSATLGAWTTRHQSMTFQSDGADWEYIQ